MSVVLLGFVLRMAWLLIAEPLPVSDYQGYRTLGETLLDKHQFGQPEPAAVRLPVYPAFLALLMLVSRGVFWLSLCNVFLSTALIPILYKLGQRLSNGNELFARICGLGCAIYPTFVFYAPVLASEHLFVLLFFGGLLLLLHEGLGATLSTRMLIGSGILLGISILTRGEAMFYLPVYLLAILFSQGTFRVRAIRGGVIVLCIALVLSPWYVRNLRLFGPGVGLSASSGLVFYFGHNPHDYQFSHWADNPDLQAPDIYQSSRRGWKAGFDYLRHDPVHVLRRMPLAFSRQYWPEPQPYSVYWSSHASYAPDLDHGTFESVRGDIPGLARLEELTRVAYALFLVLMAGSFIFWRALPGPGWLILMATLLGNWFCYCVVFWAMDRYRFTAEVAGCLLASVTVFGLVNSIRSRRVESSVNDIDARDVE